MASVWKGKKPLPMGGYVTEEVIGGKVQRKSGMGIKAANNSTFTRALRGIKTKRVKGTVGIKAINKSSFTQALNKKVARSKRKKIAGW